MQLPMGLRHGTDSLFACLRWLLLLCTVVSQALPSEQQVLQTAVTAQLHGQRKLKGRFLHITDVHPDPFYKVGSDPSGSHPCHSGDGDDSAGYYGAPSTRCDSPYSLVSATFDWIRHNLRDEVDFVIWTGDSARHDNDNRFPRSSTQVADQNRYLVDKFGEALGKTGKKASGDSAGYTDGFVVPVVPTLGNNDVLPHNIFEPGPNSWTSKYLEIWKQFIPEEQRHSFARGGWFFTEVIPNKLAVFSLNTLYFFSSNSATDGCDLKSEPGYEHMEWLRIQLQFLRQRGMKAILTGHVPPARTESKQTWDESCYQKYTLWMRQYRDVIVGSLYGHVNIDHFMFQDVRHLKYDFAIDGIGEEEMGRDSPGNISDARSPVHSTAKISYLNELRAVWSDLPTPPKDISYTSIDRDIHTFETDAERRRKGKEKDKFLKDIGGQWGERFSMSLVSPSVVPNYFPTLRLIEYNTTGLDDSHPAIGPPQGTPAHEADLITNPDEDDISSSPTPIDTTKRNKKKHKKKKKKPHFPTPLPPSPTSPPGPAHSPQTFTFLSWTQLFANLTAIHNETQVATPAVPDDSQTPLTSISTAPFRYEVEYTTNADHVYKLRDLTVRSWLDIAERIGRSEYKMVGDESFPLEHDDDGGDSEEGEPSATKKGKKHGKKKKHRLKDNRLWHVFVKRAFVHTKPDEELERDF